ncbi:hypothetical protein B0T16DRAFT_383983 [Cercophora newfieldiana]|uniref:Uncharacterized protein n=1 Tax=Cercophora newfieldiana TaxID=92897 RepID=A0AA39YM07_9PEZI|nr:hypothetical protein B0T16DRAFT_383983 [Cercophora newfieldiana]
MAAGWKPYSYEESYGWNRETFDSIYDWAHFQRVTFCSVWQSVHILLTGCACCDRKTIDKALQELCATAKTNPSAVPKMLIDILKENLRIRLPYYVDRELFELTHPYQDYDERSVPSEQFCEGLIHSPSFKDFCAQVTQLRDDVHQSENGLFSRPAPIAARETPLPADEQLDERLQFVLLSWKFQHHFQKRSLKLKKVDISGGYIHECDWPYVPKTWNHNTSEEEKEFWRVTMAYRGESIRCDKDSGERFNHPKDAEDGIAPINTCIPNALLTLLFFMQALGKDRLDLKDILDQSKNEWANKKRCQRKREFRAFPRTRPFDVFEKLPVLDPNEPFDGYNDYWWWLCAVMHKAVLEHTELPKVFPPRMPDWEGIPDDFAPEVFGPWLG